MRSVLTHILKRSFARSAENFQPGRREFLRQSALAGVALALPLQSCVDQKKSIAIIGAGIAGLTTAYTLKKNQISATLYEAQGRAGGRILTIPDAVVDGAYVDFGAEYIDSTHTDLLSLSKELNVEITDLQQDKLESHYYFFQGRKITEDELVKELQPFVPQLTKDIDSIPDELHYSKGDEYRRLDNLSVTEYLKEIGVKGWLYDFFDTVITSEYGMEASEQSAINLIYVLALPVKIGSPYHALGLEHEVFKFKGGSQQLITKLEEQVKEQIQTGWRLIKLYKNKHDYSLTFECNGKTETIQSDIVVLTLPFTVLRQVELNFEFPARKKKCIAELGFGIAAKTAMGFKKRIWREQGYQGYTYSDINRTTIWDSSQGVETTQGSLSFVTGGKESIDFQNLDYAAIKERWLGGAEKFFPGLAGQYNGRIAKFCWAANPFSKGSYASYTKGQASEFAGVEFEPFENIFFAGEHCSVFHQGFMNGAAETAIRVSRLIQKTIIT